METFRNKQITKNHILLKIHLYKCQLTLPMHLYKGIFRKNILILIYQENTNNLISLSWNREKLLIFEKLLNFRI